MAPGEHHPTQGMTFGTNQPALLELAIRLNSGKLRPVHVRHWSWVSSLLQMMRPSLGVAEDHSPFGKGAHDACDVSSAPGVSGEGLLILPAGSV